MATKLKGTVKWYQESLGYGFITSEDGMDYFAHQSEIQMDGFRKLKRSQSVTFEASKDEKDRFIALNITVEN